MSIELIVNGNKHTDGYVYTPDFITFPAGEENVNLFKNAKGMQGMQTVATVVVKANIRSSVDVMQLLLVKDAIDRWLVYGGAQISLEIPYLPYARQDRVCNKGEAHSLAVMCKLINDMHFNSVKVYDLHSTVASALLHNCIEVQQPAIISQSEELSNKLRSGNYCIVSPDAGSEKKCMAVAKYFGCTMIRATKRRDVATGKIESIEFVDPIPEGKNFLIVDDICEKGGTFFPLEVELRNNNLVELYVTHGIFSGGLIALEDRFDKIHTTDSYFQGSAIDRTKVIKL